MPVMVSHKGNIGPRGTLLVVLLFACIILLLPGILFVVYSSDMYGSWETADATIVNTTYCGDYRRRALVETDGVSRRRYLEEKEGRYIGGEYHYGPPPTNPEKKVTRKPQYSVTYSFTTNDGQSIVATTEYCTSPVPPLGGTDTIMYNPSDPSIGVIEEDYYKHYNTGGWIGLILGILIILGLGVALYLMRKKRKESNNAPYTTYDNGVNATNNAYSDNASNDKI